MNIRELNLKHFGKFKNRKLEFSDGLNLIYGENEAGKSTVHSFLEAMLFGMERGRGRAAAKDAWRRYEPWENPGYYAGQMRFSCGNRSFCLERNFEKNGKSALLYCEDDGEELSLEQGDLDMLLGGMSREQYENTVSVGQMKALPGMSLAASLKDYAANYYSAGNEGIHLEEALQFLKEEDKKLEREEKADARRRAGKREKIEMEASYIWRELHHLSQEREETKEKVEQCRRRKEALESQQKEEREKRERERFGAWRVHPMEIVSMVLVLILLVLLFSRPWSFLVLIVVALAEGIYIWNRMKDGKRRARELTDGEAEELKLLKEELGKAEWKLEQQRQANREKQTRYSNLQEQLGELDEVGEEAKEREKKRKALELAARTMNRISGEMQSQAGERLNQRISEITEQITGGKYQKVWMDTELNLHLLGEAGRVSVSQVSRGTAEQLYFALRMAASELLCEEKFPLVLDDTFVCYDDVRLERTLNWLAESGRQVLLFTCQGREERALKKSGLRYHKITL
ncbi:MAG TPA: AAA family ATPase [Candidatus Bariatricus faecipullorum]|nr:AAA family ATPase [Candidatus Bariatricus faecipullorum]